MAGTVALCFFGQVKDYRTVAASIQRHVFNVLTAHGYHYDVYAHTYNQTSFFNPRNQEDALPIQPTTLQATLGLPDSAIIYDKPEDADQWIEARELARNGDPWPDNPVKGLSVVYYVRQLYSLRRVTELWRAAEAAGKGPYDFVVYLRPDTRFLNDLDLPQNAPLLRGNSSAISSPLWHSFGGMNDRLAYGSPEVMVVYGERGYHVMDYVARGRIPNAEIYLGDYMRERGIVNVESKTVFQRVRNDGAVKLAENGLAALVVGGTVAVCFFGQVKDYGHVAASVQRRVFDALASHGYRYDVYAHTYNQATYANPRTGELPLPIHPRSLQTALGLPDAAVIYDRPEDADQWIDARELARNGDPWPDNPVKGLSVVYYVRQLYSLRRVTELWRAAEAAGKGPYDLVVYLRPDTRFLNDLDLPQNAPLLRGNAKAIATPSSLNEFGWLDDKLAYGSPEAMAVYGERGNHVMAYVAKGSKPHAETYLTQYLLEQGIVNVKSQTVFQRVLNDGTIKPGDERLAALAPGNVAVCFFGQVKNYQHVADSVQRHVFDVLVSHGYSYDVYAHTYNFSIFHNPRARELPLPIYPKSLQAALGLPDSAVIYDKPEDADQWIDARELARNGDPWPDDPVRGLSMVYYIQQLYSLKRVTELWKAAGAAGKGPYDFVVYLQPDMRFLSDLDLPQNTALLRDNNGTIAIPTERKFGWLNDKLAYGSAAAMAVYGERGNHVMAYVAKGRVPHSARYLTQYLLERGVVIVKIKTEFQLVLNDGNIRQ